MKGVKLYQLPYPVIYVCNHVSIFDLFICGAKLPHYPRGLELSEHFNYPVYGWFIRRFDMIPVNIKSARSIRKSLNFAAEILKKKIRSILIMPEGMRTRTGEILDFKNGAFYLARISGCPVVPVINRGLHEINNPNSYIIKPGRFDMVILPPVYAKDFNNDNEMMNHVRQIMINELHKKHGKQ